MLFYAAWQLHLTTEAPIWNHKALHLPDRRFSRLKPLSKRVTSSAALLMLLAWSGAWSDASDSMDALNSFDCVVEPSRTIELGVAVPGLLAESFFDRSDHVKKGVVMARLESNVERVAVDIAEQSANSSTGIELRKLTAEFGDRTRQRNSKLSESAGVSRQVLDQVNTEARIARLQVAQEEELSRLASLELQRAKALLERREIRSPIEGSVTERYISPGEYVDRKPVFQIVQLNPLHVEVIVPIAFMGSVKVGMTAQVSIDAPGFEDRLVEAEVHRIDAIADAASATFGVRLLMHNPRQEIPGGVRCHVDFLAS